MEVVCRRDGGKEGSVKINGRVKGDEREERSAKISGRVKGRWKEGRKGSVKINGRNEEAVRWMEGGVQRSIK